jgi:hypothetical protein
MLFADLGTWSDSADFGGNAARSQTVLDCRGYFDQFRKLARRDADSGGRSIESAAQDVQSAISAAGGLLPKNMPSPPTYEKPIRPTHS